MTIWQRSPLAFILSSLLLAPWTLVEAFNSPEISISPLLLTFTGSEGGPLPQDRILVLTNPGSKLLDWKAMPDQSWLEVVPNSGKLSPGQSTQLSVRIRAVTQAESWHPISSENAPLKRAEHEAVWTGSRMIVWGGGDQDGGLLNTGGIYDAATDTWVGETTLIGAPSPRWLHTMIWTGQHAIVWGGALTFSVNPPFEFTNDGYRYDAAANQWVGSVSKHKAPSPRCYHSAVWTGSRMIVWGGHDGTQRLNTGGIYDPAKDKWSSITTVNAPSPRILHAAVWTGKEMIIWGGNDPNLVDLTDGGRYDPETDTWRPMAASPADLARQAAVAVWDGWEMIIWGGNAENPATHARSMVDTGGRYNPITDQWAAETMLENAPSARQSASAVWTGPTMIMTHGSSNNGYLDTGAVYTPPVLPRGTHPASITVTGKDAQSRTATVSMQIVPPAPPALHITDTAPVPGSILGGPADSVLVTFDEPLDPGSVGADSIRLLRAGPDSTFGTGDDVTISAPVTLVGTNQVRVDFTAVPVLAQDIRLVVSGTPATFEGRFGHWKMDEGTGDVIEDASGNARVGVLNGVGWAQGIVGNSLRFLNSSTSYVVINGGSIEPSWTAAMWVNRKDSFGGAALLMEGPESALYAELPDPPRRVGFANPANNFVFDYVAPVNTWVHLTFLGTSTGTSLYADGTLVGTVPVVIPLGINILGTAGIGSLEGRLDDVQVYPRALTPSEVLSLARLRGAIRSTTNRVLDGDFAGIFPSGNLVSGGDFVATFRR